MIKPHARLLLACSLCLGLLRAETPPKSGASPVLPVEGAPAAKAASAQATMVPTVPFTTKTASSTSTNKQFTVHGGDLELRSAFCLLSEETATSLGRVLKDSGQFVLPVIVVLKTPPDITGVGPPVTLNIGELTHGGFHLQINAELRTGFRTTDFTREMVRVLLAERILRNHKKLSTTRQNDVLPAWVMTGVTQALEYRSRSRPSALFSAVFRRGQVYSLDRILAAEPAKLDALSRGIYETSTCALVLTLLEQPDGPVRFSKFLNALAVESKSDRDLLTQHFPNLAISKSAFEKWWSLQMAALATPSAMETLSVAQTEEELDTALTLMIPGARKEVERRVVAATPAAAPAAAPEEPEENKKRGLFGRMKRDPKKESKSDDKEKASQPEAQKPQEKPSPTTGASTSSSGSGFGIGFLESEVASAYWAMFPVIASLPELLGNGQEIALFKKKPKAADTAEEPEPEKGSKKSAAAPETAKTEKPASKVEPSKPKTEEPAASLARKPEQARGVGGRPEDLPKAPPVTEKTRNTEKPPAETKKDETEPPPEEDGKVDKPNPFNPRNWFRKNPKPDEEGGEASPPPAKPEGAERQLQSANTTEKSEAKAKEKPESKPEPAPEPAKTASAATSTTRSAKPGSIPLEDFALIAKRDDRSDILTRCLIRLNALKLRAHPLYRPLIDDYATLVQDLRQEKNKGAANKLEELRHERESVHQRALAVETHLDWYEANHTGTMSHAFDDFLRIDDELEKDRLPRNDDLSKYLDAVQGEFK